MLGNLHVEADEGLVRACVIPGMEARGPEKASRGATKELLASSDRINSRVTHQQQDKAGHKHRQPCPCALSLGAPYWWAIKLGGVHVTPPGSPLLSLEEDFTLLDHLCWDL